MRVERAQKWKRNIGVNELEAGRKKIVYDEYVCVNDNDG